MRRIHLMIIACVFGFTSLSFSKQDLPEKSTRVENKKKLFKSIRTQQFFKIVELRRARNEQWKGVINSEPPRHLKVKKPSTREKLKIKNIINYMIKELAKAENVKEWINNSPKALKLFRRKHFSQFGSEPIPKFVHSETQILLFENGSKKSPSLLRGFVTEKGVEFFYNSRNVTVKRGESPEAWYQRITSTTSASIFDWIIPKAHASPNLQWAHALGSAQMGMEDDNWLTYDFTDPQGLDGATLFGLSDDAKDFYNLRCQGSRAVFETRLGDRTFTVQAMNSHYEDTPGEQLIFNHDEVPSFSIIHNLFGRYGDAGSVNLRSQALRNPVGNQELLPELSALLQGEALQTSFPQSENFNNLNSDTYSDHLSQNAMAYQACVAMGNNGVDACSEHEAPGDFLDCVSSEVLGAKLPGGMRIAGTLPWSMSRTSGLHLKAELAGILNSGQINVPQSRLYPSVGPGNGLNVDVTRWNANHPGNGRANLITRLSTNLRDNDVEQAFQLCLNSIHDGIDRTSECQSYIDSLPEEEREAGARALQGLELSIQNQYAALQGSNSQFIGDLRSRLEEAGQGRPEDDNCARRFNNEEQQNLLEHLAQVERAGFQNQNLSSHLDSAIATADVGRACCSNMRCQMYMNGTLPQEERERIRPSSQ